MFDLSSAEDLNAVVPKGNYHAVVVKAELKDTKSGTGQYLNVEFKILNNGQNGRSVFQMFNIKNENPKAVQIGLGQLKELGKAVLTEAEMKNSNPQSFLNKQVEILVDIKSDNFGDKNIIKKYSKFEAEKSAQSSPF